MKNHSILTKYFFLLLIDIVIIICVYRFEQFSQVSVVAHGPLVLFIFTIIALLKLVV